MVNRLRAPSDIVQLKLRMREQLRSRLERVAEQNRTSLNSAIIDQLEQSLVAEKHLRQALELIYGPQLAGILTLIGDGMKRAGERAALKSLPLEQKAGGDWIDDPYSFRQAARAAFRIIRGVRPDGDVTRFQRGPRVNHPFDRHIGENTAIALLRNVASRDPYDELSETERGMARPSEMTLRLRYLRELLGSIVGRLKIPKYRETEWAPAQQIAAMGDDE